MGICGVVLLLWALVHRKSGCIGVWAVLYGCRVYWCILKPTWVLNGFPRIIGEPLEGGE